MDAKDKVIEQLLARIEMLEQLVREQAVQIKKQATEISELKKRLGLNSNKESISSTFLCIKENRLKIAPRKLGTKR
jgi:hypothetical protein